MPTTRTEFGIRVRDHAGQEGLFTGQLFLNGVTLEVERIPIGPQDGEALDHVWRDPSAVTAQRIVALLTDNAVPGSEFSVVEIVRAGA